eukprot:864286_1
MVLSFLFMISSLWCCTKTRTQQKHNNNGNKNEEINGAKIFRDDFKFRLEMTLMLLVLIFGFISTVFIGSNLSHPESDEFMQQISIAVIVKCIAQTASIITQILIPYITLKKK